MNKHVRKRTALAAGAALAGIALVFPAVAVAEDSGGSGRPEAVRKAQPEPGKRAELRGQRQQELAEALAKDLGVPEEKVTESLKKFRAAQREERGEHAEKRKHFRGGERPAPAELREKLTARLDQAVKDGKLTRTQADAILAAVDAGVLPGRPAAGPRAHQR
ncbi:hypothetical protein DEJ50_01345 [Streptomyces venezuelae]|uniref:Secreted protein n=1 Tax=Streptomyces venezuelae TaxID=54571 RepID=A0A5P2CXI6_STRVZ|nr:hypothetical protein [Streptomyces venezuelae]QES46697.1 hypothetical protein DEJ50_01345 [Streptomyces venezuelae]